MKEVEVLVTGTFLIVHPGHCELLEYASGFGRVTVGLNADAYLHKKYGNVIIPADDRAYVLSCNRFVSGITIFDEEEPSALVRRLRPLYYVKGPDYAGPLLPELKACTDVGAKIIIHQAQKVFNSSGLKHLVIGDKAII